MFSPYAAMGNSPGMMIDPNGELTKDAQPVQDDGMSYAGLDAMAVRAFMDGVMSGLYNINFMFGSNTMVMAGGGGSAGVQNGGGQEWLPKYTDNMNMCNVFRAAISEVSSMDATVNIKGFTVAPDMSIYVTYSVDGVVWNPTDEGDLGLAAERFSGERTTKLSLAPKGDLQKQQSGGGWATATLAFISADIAIPEATDGAWPKWAGYAVAGTTAYLYLNGTTGLAGKMSKEIDAIWRNIKGPYGYVYELRVRQGGQYMDVRGNCVVLNAGDIWKFGESTKMTRYSQAQLQNMVPGGVYMNRIYFGDRGEIKVMEKYFLYGYYFNKGHLPPGNRIFR